MRRPLAVLRPEPGNAATATRIEALGRVALRLPLFSVEARAWEVPDAAAYDALLVTSANAIRHGGAGLTRLTTLPVHAVGEATAEAARAAGFRVATVGDAGVAALLPALEGLRLLHLAGREHREVPGADTVIAYASLALDVDGRRLTGTVALLHSPRAARRLAEIVADRAAVAIAAISAAALDAAGPGWAARAMAAAPTDAALIAAAAGLAD